MNINQRSLNLLLDEALVQKKKKTGFNSARPYLGEHEDAEARTDE